MTPTTPGTPAVKPWPPADLDQRVEAVRLATAHYPLPGQQHAAIATAYRITPVPFWQVVNGLIDMPEVNAALPAECRRLRQARDVRSARRAALRATMGDGDRG